MNYKTKVKAVAITTGLITQEDGTRFSAEDIVAYCARVSNPSNQLNTETNTKLLKYLRDHKHWSPFEMVDMILEVETTRDIARQMLRHRSFYFQEFSQRYADPTKDLEFVRREARLQDKKNRQNSIETNDDDLKVGWEKYQNAVKLLAVDAYDWAIENDIAKEQARAVLPEGMMQSRIYMKGTLRGWIHYCELRTELGTQKEHREIAVKAAAVIRNHIPFLKEWFENVILPQVADLDDLPY